ncbi:uncharacterized protein abca12 [Xyrichtys novacula]|uniref:Uncharacterized protein abca12 n=1 Tax=Xyrichtys novacula TaxID=13765 RepID=A0AAV1H208_XYRNO|nr:uncharacterized protein abca12 [Xyrichtys novacula]
MAFLQQLRLLLWKNGLEVIRQPLWSLTLVIWPLIIFIIVAVTRHQFPPQVKPTCYVGPRNLPSTGFFPFLQTLMCNSDSHCHNKSLVVDPASSRTTSSVHESSRSSFPGKLIGGDLFNFRVPDHLRNDPADLVKTLNSFVGSLNGGENRNASFMEISAALENNETLHQILEMADVLKKAACAMTLPMIDTTSQRPASQAVVTFCKSNETVFEVTLNMLNQVLLEAMQTHPDEMATLAGVAVVFLDELQSQTSLWESFIALPKLLSSGSVDEALDSVEVLLTNVQRAMGAIQSKYLEAGAPLSLADPIIAVGLSVIHHAQKWPGSDVSIPLGEVVILHSDSLSEMVKQVLQNVQIPLRKAIALTLDKETLHSYLCDDSNRPMWLSAACSTGTVRMVLGYISPIKVAQQALLAWCKHVSQYDLAFAKGLLNSPMGEVAPRGQGGPHNTRTRRSAETYPLSIEEELFLEVGKNVLKLLQLWPEAEQFVQSIIRSGFQYMEFATLALETVEEIIANVLKDADHLQQTSQKLMTNQSEASMFFNHVLDSAMELILKAITSGSLTCEDALASFEWLLQMETVQIEVWKSLICQSISSIQQALLMEVMPLVESAEVFNSTVMSHGDENVTLPMVLSAWQKMYNSSLQIVMLVDRLAFDVAYWTDWMPDNITYDVVGTLQQSVIRSVVNLGETIEDSDLWPEVKDYFHIVDWVLNYRPGVETPHNCSLDISDSAIKCDTDSGFKWPQFVAVMAQALLSPDEDFVINSLKGAVNLLQHVYKDVVLSTTGSLLKENIKGGDALSNFLINLMQSLQRFVNKVSMLPDEDIADPDTIEPLVQNLLQSTGLTSLLPLFTNNGPVNVSTVLHVAIKLIRHNQHIFTFNETDPTMPELEKLIMQFLSLRGNLSVSLSNTIGHTLLTYAGHFNPDAVDKVREAIRPFTNQTSAGIVEAILRAMELLNSVTNTDGDPTQVILGYVSQIQNFLTSLYRLGSFQQLLLPNGDLNATQFTDLHLIFKEFFNLLSPAGIQSLIQAGPDAALDRVLKTLIPFLPKAVQQDAARFLQDFKDLLQHLTNCAAGQDCLGDTSEIFTFLDEILDLILSAKGDVSITIAAPSPFSMGQDYVDIASIFLPLTLSSQDAAYVNTFKQALHFIDLVITTPNITLSAVQYALQQSNLTVEELKNLTSLFGAVNIDDLKAKIMAVTNAQRCFQLQHNQMVTPQCVMGLITGVTGVLGQLPALKEDTAILDLVHSIIKLTISDVMEVDFISSPFEAVIHTLNRTLANIREVLQQGRLITTEIMKEIQVLEELVQLAANPEPFIKILNVNLTADPALAQKVYLETVQWYLTRLEKITEDSSLSDFLQPFFQLLTTQVKVQLAHADFTVFLTKRIEYLTNNLQTLIDGQGLSEIGKTVIEIAQELKKLIKVNLEIQSQIPGFNLLVNDTALDAAGEQIDLYLDIAQNCFELQQDQMLTPKCVSGLVSGVTGLLKQLPNLQNESALVSLIPGVLNKTIKEVMEMNISSNPHQAVIHTMNRTLANIKMTLQMNNVNSPGIMKEIQVLEELVKLAANPDPLIKIFNTTLAANPALTQKVFVETMQWYLTRLEKITEDSSLSDTFKPLFQIMSMLLKMQQAQAEFSVFLTKRIEYLTNNIEVPIDGEGLSKIGQMAVEIVHRLFKVIKRDLEIQNHFAGSEMFNTTALHAAEQQMKLYLDMIQKWMKHPNVPSVLSSLLQWGNISNASTPFKDLHHLLQTMVHFFNDEQLAYISIVGNITQSVSNALMAAEQPGGLQSESFLASILEAVGSMMKIPSPIYGPLSHRVEQNIQEVVYYSLKLIVQPDMSFRSSRLISLKILKSAESIIKDVSPKSITEYLLPGIKIITTYFESTLTVDGPDGWNQLVLNEMKTVHSLLPPDSPAHAYVSILINVTHFILESGQGNMSLWAMFENASEENAPMILEKMGKLLTIFWPLIMDPHTGPPPLKGLAHVATVLQQVITGMADKDTWHKLEKIIEALLSVLKATGQWEHVPPVIPLFEKIIGSVVNNMQAENVMILSLQMPVVTLMREIVHSVNSSQSNLTEALERMQVAIEDTMQAAQQANGSLECSDVLKLWGPVGEAAGLSNSTMALWCNINLQPVLEAYTEAQIVFSHLNMSHMGVGSMTVDATAARIVRTLQSLYQVSINRTLVAEKLIMTFSNHLNMLTGQPLSPEAQHYWYMQLQDMQLQNSLTTLNMLTDELLSLAPSLQPYVKAVETALHYILSNYHGIQDESSAEYIFKEAIGIFLHKVNLTSADFLSLLQGHSSALDKEALVHTMSQAVKHLMIMFEGVPMVYQGLEYFLTSNDTRMIMEKVAELAVWLASVEEYGMGQLDQALLEVYRILSSLVSALTGMDMDKPGPMGLFEELAYNIVAMVRQMVATSGILGPMEYHHGMYKHDMTSQNHTKGVRRKREYPVIPMRSPLEDFLDLLYIDYPTMFKAMSAPTTTREMMETAHIFFANPDLNVVMKGITSDMGWYLNASREDTIDAAVGMLSFFTLPSMFDVSAMELLMYAAEMLPDGLPFASDLQDISKALARESQENLLLMEKTFHTAAELLQIGMTDPSFIKQLEHLTSKVCAVEKTKSVRVLMRAVGLEPGQLCDTFMPALQIVVKTLTMNVTTLTNVLFEMFIGNPQTYDVNFSWTSVLSEGLSFNISGLSSLNINITSPGAVTVGEMLRNKTAFVEDVQRHTDFDPTALQLLMKSTLPNNNLVILSWLVNLRHCDSISSARLEQADAIILKVFCNMSVADWYSFSLLMAHHLNTEKLIYRMVLSDETQYMVGVMLQMAEVVINLMDKILPAVDHLQSYMSSIEDVDLNSQFPHKTRVQRSTQSIKPSFVTLSRALCSNGIVALFGLSKLPLSSDNSDPSSQDDLKREEMIERFKLPRNASPFCMNIYLDMVNTTGGAIAWAFLKPMLMGQILYTPDTPATRNIMEKSNATLHELANLRKYSKEWIESSGYIFQAAEILSHTLPMLQNSLGNSFVKNFIEMQTDINVGTMKETLSNFSNMTMMLDKNKHMLDQITTLSTLMMNLSSCIKFDRYRGYDSEEQLNADAQDLAKNRDLYASVIFKLPKDGDSSRKRRAASFTTSLPPKVSYTIRMHMDNVMRTDRMRNPFFTKETHISASQTMRYNRGFIYLQETIDRAIIATQTGQTVTEPAVQLQAFPYPCHLRDEYLEAISFVFPLMLMAAWLLFVANFVKKLVHERELRLHEYMKMMGVNPLSHFLAWFLESAAFLLVTIIILTLIMKFGGILPHSDGFILFLYLCNYGLSILAFSYLVSSFFDKTFIAGLSGSLLYILCFFPFIIVMAIERTLTFSQKSILSLFSPSCFSYASQYMSRYESQGEGIQWSNSYTSPISGDTASFGWLNWLMLIDSILYFIVGAYIRMVFPGKYGIPAPWYFPFQKSFWANLCCCVKSNDKSSRGLLFTNIMQKNLPVFSDDKGKGQSTLSSQAGENFSHLPVGVSLHGLSKMYGDRVAIENLNVSFYEGHVTSLLGHNGAGKTTTMSLLTGLYSPTSGSIEVYGRDMQTHIDDVRKELGVCMQYDVLFDHMTTKEHLLLYGQIKAPHWSDRELREQVRTILEETGMYAHRHKRVGTLSGGMKRKLSISIAFIGGSRLVVLDEPTTGVDPCSRRAIWDIVIQHKKNRTIIMSTHHLDEAEVLSDRITFLERGGLKCCGSPFYLKDKLGQGYRLTLTKKIQSLEAEQIDNAELKAFIQAHVPEARLREAQGGDLVYSLPPFNSSNASSYRSLLTALDSNLDALQLGGYGVSDTTLEEVFLQLAHENTELGPEHSLPSISETVSDTASIDSFPSDLNGSIHRFSDNIKLTGSTMVRGMALAWQQVAAVLTKRFHHSRRDLKGLIAQILLPVLFMVFAMGLSSIRNDLQHFPELKLSPDLYKFDASYSFFSNSNPNSEKLLNTMMSFPGMDNSCLDKPNNPVCSRTADLWRSSGNSSKAFSTCKCTGQEQVCETYNNEPPHKSISSSQIVYNLSGINVEDYLLATTNDFIRNRYGGFAFGMPLPPDLQLDIKAVPKNRTLAKVWFNPEGHHTMPAYLNSINNFILRSNLPADKDPRKYAISVSSHPYFGRVDDEDTVVQGMLQILVAMCVLTGFSITTASFAIYVVNEHHSGSKRLQHIAGISEPFYWAINFFYDMVVFIIPVALTVAVIAAFQVPAFTDRQNLGAVALLLVLFGFATFPWMYLLSGIFRDAEMAFIIYVCINLFISVNTILSTSILYFLSQISTIDPKTILAVFDRLCSAFVIFPQFNFGQGLMYLARKNIEVQILSGYGIDAYEDPFSTDALGKHFIASFIEGLIFFSLRLLLNKFLIRKVRHLICGRKTVPHMAKEDEDEDVANEHLRVSSGAAGSDVLQVNQLSKVYQNFSRKVHAVKRVSLGIPTGECFGLLGVNGAGKTTTFKMLTGDVSPTDGTAQIRDRDGRLVDIMECRNQGINIGYCPQVDALDNLLTGEEHLYFYGRIRGISKRELDGVVRYLLKRLELNYHRNITTEGYSCGTRRKLSTALALIGHPQILLLDEPSSGMDPRTKRHLWKIISEEVKGKCAVVLTSHSMEECEALCSRLAIMVKGQFRCLGSLQHIKNRFGSGFTVKMYLAEASSDAEAITGFMQRRFPSTYLKDQHSSMVEYHVPVAPGGVADIFDQLESNKNTLRIKHFSVSQTTLDEVFINFAMEKDDMESIPVHSQDDFGVDSLGSISAVET